MKVRTSERKLARSGVDAVEGRTHSADLQPGDAHGIEGVDVEDIEAATSIHQHLGEAVLVDDGVNDEWVVT